MTQNEKDLLMKDLCARLPYKVKVQITSRESKNRIVYLTEDNICHLTSRWWSKFKPYLFPLSSMTYKQIHEFNQILGKDCDVSDGYINIIDSSRRTFSYQELDALLQLLNKNHFDYRGLIEKGLAIDATELNIY